MYDFLTITLNDGMWKKDEMSTHLNGIFNQDFYDIVAKTMLMPEKVGFDVSDKLVLLKLPDQVLDCQLYHHPIYSNIWLQPLN